MNISLKLGEKSFLRNTKLRLVGQCQSWNQNPWKKSKDEDSGRITPRFCYSDPTPFLTLWRLMTLLLNEFSLGKTSLVLNIILKNIGLIVYPIIQKFVIFLIT